MAPDVSQHRSCAVSYWVELFTIPAIKRLPRKLGEIAFRHLFKSRQLFPFIQTLDFLNRTPSNDKIRIFQRGSNDVSEVRAGIS
jgi:hypothetical protein